MYRPTDCGSLLSTLYHLPGDVISATVSIVYINVKPEYELSKNESSYRLPRVLDNSRNFEKKFGALSPIDPLRKKFARGLSSCQ